jgi:hypothetical protein
VLYREVPYILMLFPELEGFASHFHVLYREVPYILYIKKAVPGEGTAR